MLHCSEFDAPKMILEQFLTALRLSFFSVIARRLVLGAIALLLPPSHDWSSAQVLARNDLRIAFDQEKAPYLWSDRGGVKGLEFDIVTAALAASGHAVVPVTLPNRRVAAALTLRVADGITGVQAGDAGASAFYSDFYLTYANAAVTRARDGIKLSGLDAIRQYRVAAWQKAWQDLKLDRLQGPDILAYTEFTSQYRQTKFFWAGRADIDIVDRNIFIWYSRILSKEMDTSGAVTFHEVVPSVRVRAAFNRSSDRDDFNAGMKTIIANGEVGRIYAKYGLPAPEPLFSQY